MDNPSECKSLKSFSSESSLKGQEKWSSVRITDSKKNSIKVENLVSIHSNLNLNGLCNSDKQSVLGKEVMTIMGLVKKVIILKFKLPSTTKTMSATNKSVT